MTKGGVILKVKKGGYYQHYRGNIYKVLDIARHTETGEELVIYMRGELGTPDDRWARPRAMFEEKVKVDKDGEYVEVDRFYYLGGGRNFV